jgi:hypothetical protein
VRWFSRGMAGGFLPYLNHEPPYSYDTLLGTSFRAATSTPIPASILRAVNLRDGRSRRGSNAQGVARIWFMSPGISRSTRESSQCTVSRFFDTLKKLIATERRHPIEKRDQTSDEKAPSFTPRMPLAKRLWELRQEVLASGVPLLNLDEIRQEL